MPRSESPSVDRSVAFASILAASAIAVAIGACSSESSAPRSEPSAPSDPTNDDGGSETTHDAGTTEEPASTFLDPSAYDDLVTIDPSFPFGITQRHEADAFIVGSHWGRHGGPMVTTGTYGSSGVPKIVQWNVTGGATAPAIPTDRALATASGLPSTYFYGADGMIDLPFGSLSLLSYTGSGYPYSGEALLYTADYGTVSSRAKANGFYSGTGVEIATGPLLVFSGLSSLSASGSSTDDNGLYASPVCQGSLVSVPPCGAPRQLFRWEGQSGPVVADGHGNVFVGASLASGATSDVVYGLTKSQIARGAAVTPATLAAVDTKGTASLAAVAPEGEAPGWVVGLGYDATSTVYAASFTERDDALSKNDTFVEAAVTRANGDGGLSVFSDPDGDLWLAVTKGSKGAYLELRRKTSPARDE